MKKYLAKSNLKNKKISDQNLICQIIKSLNCGINPPPERIEIDGGLINKGLTM